MDGIMEKEKAGPMSLHKKGITGSTLKIIAIVSMLIDHTGAVLLERILIQQGWYSALWRGEDALAQFYQDNLGLYILFFVMRYIIGRWAFPIFCFLLVEGFSHTRNVVKYACRLGIFALLSEVPFDLALYGTPFYRGHQNVFFTLFIGLLTMFAFRSITEKLKVHFVLKLPVYALALITGLAVADLLCTDYGARGVLSIMALYIFRNIRWQQLLAGSVTFLWEFPAPLGFLPAAVYNGKRGLNIKYFFYAFYPIHFFCLYLVAYFWGLI